MRTSAFLTILMLSLFLAACQVKIPFLKESKYSIRAPASIAGEEGAISSAEFESREIDIALSVCQDLRSLRFNYDFFSKSERQFSVDLKHLSCDGPYKEQLGLNSFFGDKTLHFSEAITDENGPLASFCSRILHGEEILEDTELSSSGELLQYHFFIGPDKKKAFSIVHSYQDADGQHVLKDKETFYLSTSRDIKKRGFVVKRILEKPCATDPSQGMERYEQVLKE